ncbi:cytochrome c oxidase subunit II [Haloglomus salinum]|jgi:cytochrome c oxidase subunit 2|uniref:cytochrome c oxidase subunit II n=1 Tax=Haloglomus salinum TaxID=2962673 RepID=UPI0020C9D091|nr:cytochrome c oxidase subunit II [Haloglomus salinum]
MEIHRYEKAWFVAGMVLIVGFIATIAYGAVGPGIAMVDDSGGTVGADPIANGNWNSTDAFREPGVYRTGENSFDVYIVAQRFAFNPGTGEPVRLPTGSEVTFYVASADVMHGFNIAGTNVNVMVAPGQVSEMTARFDEAGTYGIVCHEYCGAGHHDMAGTLEVVPQSEYDYEAANSEQREQLRTLQGGDR